MVPPNPNSQSSSHLIEDDPYFLYDPDEKMYSEMDDQHHHGYSNQSNNDYDASQCLGPRYISL